jgi:mannose-6-phosphate isomerase-like protein (cupin superfamily)
MDAVVLLPGQGERIEAGAITTTMKATAATTGGAFSLSEGTIPAGMSGPPPHAHRQTTDTYYVLEGTLRVTVSGREVDAPAGSYILVPPGVVHTFANTSDAPVRVLNLNAPGGWEHYLRELAGAMHAGTFPGTAEFARLVAKYDFVLPA